MTDPIPRLNAALSGRYRMERQIGEGGMATVYLADDLRHERNVALKVLKPELAAVVGAERFLAEIKTTANLQHPHILPLFDSGQADSFLFYVMPYVEGESLCDRLDREHQLPVDEAVKIATSVAEALDYAHGKGVIHRDIKPANILLLQGKPVLSDFGIALAVGAAGGGRLTETGLSLGTPHYMSPEQATGDLHVGPATDIYALGCVLYEMLVGEPPYTGSTPQAILGKIITGTPVAVREQRKSVPANVEGVIARALEKVPADRFASAAELARALGDPGFRHGQGTAVGMSAASPWNRLSMALAALLVLASAGLVWSLRRPATPAPLARFESPFREGQAPIGWYQLTPDGSALVYAGPSESLGGQQLWIRAWNEPDATPIPGTEGTLISGALSPDGREVVFATNISGNELRVVSLVGGPARTLADDAYSNSFSADAWSTDGWVYFTTTDRGIGRVRESGGPVETVTEPAEGELIHTNPQPLPGGRSLLFVAHSGQDGLDPAIWSVDLETHARKVLTLGLRPLYTTSGHLLFGSPDGSLMAAPFDPRRVELTGDAAPVIQGPAQLPIYTVSTDGSLAYTSGVAAGPGRLERELVWVTRTGDATPVSPGDTIRWITAQINNGLRLSPDGRRVAFTSLPAEGGSPEVWSKSLPDGAVSRLTSGYSAQGPSWSPDGRSVTFNSVRTADGRGVVIFCCLWVTPANGVSPPTFLYGSPGELQVGEGVWSPDGTWLVMRSNQLPGGIHAMRPGVDSVATPLVASEQFAENYRAISHDGRWLAYTSNETGRHEVFVRPFPNVNDDKWPISRNGGMAPVWAHDERELFFVDPATGELKAAEFTVTGDSFRLANVSSLFNAQPFAPPEFGTRLDRFYDVSLDDQRFLMTRSLGNLEEEGGTTIILVQNFVEELKRLVPN